MTVSTGLLIYGTENDSSYIDDVFIRWILSLGLYELLVVATGEFIIKTTTHFRPAAAVSICLITQANFLGIFFFIARKEVQKI